MIMMLFDFVNFKIKIEFFIYSFLIYFCQEIRFKLYIHDVCVMCIIKSMCLLRKYLRCQITLMKVLTIDLAYRDNMPTKNKKMSYPHGWFSNRYIKHMSFMCLYIYSWLIAFIFSAWWIYSNENSSEESKARKKANKKTRCRALFRQKRDSLQICITI